MNTQRETVGTAILLAIFLIVASCSTDGAEFPAFEIVREKCGRAGTAEIAFRNWSDRKGSQSLEPPWTVDPLMWLGRPQHTPSNLECFASAGDQLSVHLLATQILLSQDRQGALRLLRSTLSGLGEPPQNGSTCRDLSDANAYHCPYGLGVTWYLKAKILSDNVDATSADLLEAEQAYEAAVRLGYRQAWDARNRVRQRIEGQTRQ